MREVLEITYKHFKEMSNKRRLYAFSPMIFSSIIGFGLMYAGATNYNSREMVIAGMMALPILEEVGYVARARITRRMVE